MDICMLCLRTELPTSDSATSASSLAEKTIITSSENDPRGYTEYSSLKNGDKFEISSSFITICGANGSQLNIKKILLLHLPLQFHQIKDEKICSVCWQTIYNFHLLHERVYEMNENRNKVQEVRSIKRTRDRSRNVNPPRTEADFSSESSVIEMLFEKIVEDKDLPKGSEEMERIDVKRDRLIKTGKEITPVGKKFPPETAIKSKEHQIQKESMELVEMKNKMEEEEETAKRPQEICRKIYRNRTDSNIAACRRRIILRSRKFLKRQLISRYNLRMKAKNKLKLKEIAEGKKKYSSAANILKMRKSNSLEYERIIRKFFKENSMHCPKCQLPFEDFYGMKEHFRLKHIDEEGNSGYVICCDRRFKTRKSLAEHFQLHCDPEHFKCPTCGKNCLDTKALKQHKITHIPFALRPNKSFQCEKCSKIFASKASFEYHSLAVHVPKEQFQYQCHECHKKLPTQRTLLEHQRKVHNPHNSLICDKCGKIFQSRSNLKSHHETKHSKQPKPTPEPQQCPICSSWLRHSRGLKEHLKSMHENSTMEHRCHICNKVSSTARALKRHIYHNHECIKKFQCTLCEKSFKRAQNLKEHTSVHTGEILYTCPNCPMTFFSSANMYKHRQRQHRSEWEAERQKPIPPNIMGQAKQSSKLNKLKKLSIITSGNEKENEEQ